MSYSICRYGGKMCDGCMTCYEDYYEDEEYCEDNSSEEDEDEEEEE